MTSFGLHKESKELAGFWLHLEALQVVICGLGAIPQTLESVYWRKCLQFIPHGFHFSALCYTMPFPTLLASDEVPSLTVACPSVSIFVPSFLPHTSSYSISLHCSLPALPESTHMPALENLLGTFSASIHFPCVSTRCSWGAEMCSVSLSALEASFLFDECFSSASHSCSSGGCSCPLASLPLPVRGSLRVL